MLCGGRAEPLRWRAFSWQVHSDVPSSLSSARSKTDPYVPACEPRRGLDVRCCGASCRPRGARSRCQLDSRGCVTVPSDVIATHSLIPPDARTPARPPGRMPKNVGVSQTQGCQGSKPESLRGSRTVRSAATKAVRFVEPSSSRGGRRFEPVDELHLNDLVASLAASLPGQGEDVLVVPEMPSPLGLPDFVALVGGREWLDARVAASVPPVLSEIECAVLAALSPVRSLAPESVARRIGWAPSEVQRVTIRLTRVGAVSASSTGAVRLHPALRPTGTMFAVEVKLKAWHRAILQGRTYRTWADNYVVVLGRVGATAEARAKESARSDGGGLFTDGGWVVRPRSRKPVASRRLQGFEHLYAALSSGPAL